MPFSQPNVPAGHSALETQAVLQIAGTSSVFSISRTASNGWQTAEASSQPIEGSHEFTQIRVDVAGFSTQ
jgi:hypothetical protein